MTASNITENRKMVVGTWTGPASYVTGGDAVTAATFGLSRLDQLIISAVSEGGYGWAWDPSAAKIKALWVDTTTDGAPMAEVATDTDLDAEVVGYIAFGLP